MIYPYDVKVLKALKTAQYSEQFYVYIDTVSGNFYHLKSLNREDVDSVLNYSSVTRVKNKKGFLSSSLSNLIEEKCVKKPAMGSMYQVTYDGWQLPAARRSERMKLILTHVAFPAFVALFTTVLTLVINSWLSK